MSKSLDEDRFDATRALGYQAQQLIGNDKTHKSRHEVLRAADVSEADIARIC